MQVNQFSNIVEALQYLNSQGYSHSFVNRGEELYCPELARVFAPEELTIVCYHRFEGSKDLGDVSVVYAVTGEPDVKGVIVDAYGTYADADLAECLRRLRVAVAV